MKERLAIIGGDFSGVALAARFARDGARFPITVFERRPRFGPGFAHGTAAPFHLLNVRVKSMSAFEDDPEHLRRWQGKNGLPDGPETYLPRGVYGRYLAAGRNDSIAGA